MFAYTKAKNGELNRFSVLTLKQLTKIHDEFPAEELLLVELVTQNKGAITAKAVSGRAREPRFKKKIAEMYGEEGPVLSSTIACVSGFLINMVEKSIRLISPCNASDKWPLGYMIFDERTFTSPGDFREKMEAMIEQNMPVNLDLNTFIQFRKDLKYEATKNGFMLKNSVSKHTYKDDLIIAEIGKYLAKGKAEVADVVTQLHIEQGFDMSEVIFKINQLFNTGLFDNDPDWKVSPGMSDDYAEKQVLQEI